MSTFYDIPQGDQQWHLLRRGKVTASNMDKILTPKALKPSAQQRGLIAEMIADVMSPFFPRRAESYTSRPMQFGRETEEEARRFYMLEKGIDVTNGGIFISDCERFGASPDGVVGEEGLLEIKCPNENTHVEYLIAEEVPLEYLLQCHGQLLVSGRKYVDFLSYAAGIPPLLVRVVPDSTTEALHVALEAFWPTYQAALRKVRGDVPETKEDGEVVDPVEKWKARIAELDPLRDDLLPSLQKLDLPLAEKAKCWEAALAHADAQGWAWDQVGKRFVSKTLIGGNR